MCCVSQVSTSTNGCICTLRVACDSMLGRIRAASVASEFCVSRIKILNFIILCLSHAWVLYVTCYCCVPHIIHVFVLKIASLTALVGHLKTGVGLCY